jgi:hypothetical protein
MGRRARFAGIAAAAALLPGETEAMAPLPTPTVVAAGELMAAFHARD